MDTNSLQVIINILFEILPFHGHSVQLEYTVYRIVFYDAHFHSLGLK